MTGRTNAVGGVGNQPEYVYFYSNKDWWMNLQSTVRNYSVSDGIIGPANKVALLSEPFTYDGAQYNFVLFGTRVGSASIPEDGITTLSMSNFQRISELYIYLTNLVPGEVYYVQGDML